jgi:siroheme synthase (precorrin-2 oxidase/ferrochelatase)
MEAAQMEMQNSTYRILLIGGNEEGVKFLPSGLPLIYYISEESVSTHIVPETLFSPYVTLARGTLSVSDLEHFIRSHHVIGVICAGQKEEKKLALTTRKAAERAKIPYIYVLGREDIDNGAVDSDMPLPLQFEEGLLWGRERLNAQSKPVFPYFPFYKSVSVRAVTVVGGGKEAAHCADVFALCGAVVHVISPFLSVHFTEASSLNTFEWTQRSYQKSDLHGATTVVAATDDRNINQTIAHDAKSMKIEVAVVDAPNEGTFFFPSQISEGPVSFSIANAGKDSGVVANILDRLKYYWQKWVWEIKANDERSKNSVS